MANSRQALKRHRQNLKRRERNQFYKVTVRSLLKEARAQLHAGDQAEATAAVRKVSAYLDHAVTRNALPKGRASRLKSRLNRQLAAL